MHTHFHDLMKYKTDLRGPTYSQNWICNQATGSFQCKKLKTAFCPGPGMGLYEFCRKPFGVTYEFCRKPFGVTDGPSSFQRLMDKVLHGLSFVTSYIDDVLIHSNSMELHQSHLRLVFNSEGRPDIEGFKV